jgi:hypothetical protein
VESEVSMRLGSGEDVPASWFAPAGAGPFPAWIALHGITRPGRAHPTLVHFARALAASGAVVVIPEVPTWRALDLDAHAADSVVRAALARLSREPGVTGRPGLIGFSFGGPQVLRIAADPVLGARLAGVASFGGYADMEALIRFQMTGDVASETTGEYIRPDPYARWVIAANILPHAEGGATLGGVADALRVLASDAGDRGTVSWDPVYDPLKDELEATLKSEHREIFRLFAPASEADPPSDHPEVERWVEKLIVAARRMEPSLELPPRLDLLAPAHILHGRNDTLIPWTEAAALSARIRSPRPRTTVTSLFAHSGRDSGGRIADALESIRLANSLRRVLDIP